jgi:hypothetical protein
VCRAVCVCVCVCVLAPQVLDDYYSAALGRKGPASRVTRLASFPSVLVIQLQRYYTAGGPELLLGCCHLLWPAVSSIRDGWANTGLCINLPSLSIAASY